MAALGGAVEPPYCAIQGYLAHKKSPPPPGRTQGPGHRPTVGSYVGGVSYERGAWIGRYLEGELAGGGEDERGEVAAFGGAVEGSRVEDALQDGQRERQRLPGPCKIERETRLRSIYLCVKVHLLLIQVHLLLSPM